MRVLVTGAAGFIGRKLTAELTSRWKEEIDSLILFDAVDITRAGSDHRLTVSTGDIAEIEDIRRAVGGNVDVVFHLAAIVSANAEEDFDLGYRINLRGMENLLECCRELPRPPRVVYTSSTACFGGELPDVVPDSWPLTPQTSYGAQKAIGELLLQDYSRKGFLDGRGLRLPTIIVRPGKPNRAASTFASSIIREPLAGKAAVCPVAPESRMYVLSPRMAVRSLIRAAELPRESFGKAPTVTLPGLGITIGDLVGALGKVAGQKTVERIEWKLDPAIQKIVSGWPGDFRAERARLLGFESDGSIEEIIRGYIEDEM